MVPLAHPSPHSKRHLDRFGHFCTAAEHWQFDRIARWHQCAHYVTHASLGPSESTTQMASRSVQPLLHSWQQSIVGHAFPIKISPWHGSLAHPRPQSKWHHDWFSQLCTANSTVSLGMRRHVLSPKNRTFTLGNLDPPSNTWFLGPPSPYPKQFSCFCTADRSVPILYNGRFLPPSKLPLPMGGSWPHLIHGSLGPPESSTHTASWSV